MKTDYPIHKISWSNLERITTIIANDINKSDIKIDSIVAILKGGMPISMLLGSKLGIDVISALHLRRSTNNLRNTTFEETSYLGITNHSIIEDKNVLLVDDIYDSGKTMKTAIEYVKKYKPRNIYVAIAYSFNKKKHNLKEFIGSQEIEYKWIVFPWER